MRYEQHPLSAAFPAMGEKEFQELAADIKANGLRDSIVIFERQVLDGWHRYQACLKSKTNPRVADFAGDPVAFVLSKNAHRRHMTGSQRAAAIVKCVDWKPVGRPNPEPGSGLSEAEMATQANVSDRTIRHAKAAEEAGLGDAVRDGKVTAKKAASIAKLPEDERAEAIEHPEDFQPKKPKLKVVGGGKDAAQAAAVAAELDDARAALAETQSQVKELVKDNESYARSLDEHPDIKAALAEAKRYREENRILQERINGLMGEKAELTRLLKHWKRTAEKLQRGAA